MWWTRSRPTSSTTSLVGGWALAHAGPAAAQMQCTLHGEHGWVQLGSECLPNRMHQAQLALPPPAAEVPYDDEDKFVEVLRKAGLTEG